MNGESATNDEPIQRIQRTAGFALANVRLNLECTYVCMFFALRLES